MVQKKHRLYFIDVFKIAKQTHGPFGFALIGHHEQ